MSNYIITFYDLEDNIIAQFDSYKEAAMYFNTSDKVIQAYISRRKLHTPLKKKYDKRKRVWGYLIKDTVDEEQDRCPI